MAGPDRDEDETGDRLRSAQDADPAGLPRQATPAERTVRLFVFVLLALVIGISLFAWISAQADGIAPAAAPRSPVSQAR